MKLFFSPRCLAFVFATSTGIFHHAVNAEYVCTGDITTDIDDNIKVPEGATCAIKGVTVKTVNAKEGSTLSIEPDGSNNLPTINGNVKCDKCLDLTVTGAFYDGSATVNGDIEAREATGSVSIDHTNVDGKIKIEDSNLMLLEVFSNVLTDNIEVTGCDLGTSYNTLRVSDNTVPADKEVLIKQTSALHVAITGNGDVKKLRFEENNFHGDLNCMADAY